ncbi:hypothetical protein AB0M47_20860 [Hamadaea sp. NPDC051192]|uniref:hypothetical protein n=1 Tax=Hamadaea sp. NPDC051192 TaxID=3154940 RepID=UPI0034322B92
MFAFLQRLRRASEPQPVRRDQVLRLINLGMRETDADDRIMLADEPTAAHLAFEQAQREYYAALGESTPAEKDAAFAALGRHGY